MENNMKTISISGKIILASSAPKLPLFVRKNLESGDQIRILKYSVDGKYIHLKYFSKCLSFDFTWVLKHFYYHAINLWMSSSSYLFDKILHLSPHRFPPIFETSKVLALPLAHRKKLPQVMA